MDMETEFQWSPAGDGLAVVIDVQVAKPLRQQVNPGKCSVDVTGEMDFVDLFAVFDNGMVSGGVCKQTTRSVEIFPTVVDEEKRTSLVSPMHLRGRSLLNRWQCIPISLSVCVS